MARYLLLHGYGGVGPDHWLVWLSQALRERGHVARIRKLPAPTAPDLHAWLTAMRDRLAILGALGEPAVAGHPGPAGDERGDPSGPLVVVAHSMGGLLWLRHAQEAAAEEASGDGPRLAVADRAVLVTPPRLPDDIGHTPWHDLDLARVDPARVARHTRMVISGDDPFWPGGGAAEGIAAPLGLAVDHIGDRRHVEPRDGYGPWPSMLAWCLGETDAITA